MGKGKKYGQTDEEKWASESLASREIVSEILNYGVTQRQIMNIAYLLSLELEDRNALQAISGVIKEHLDGETTTASTSKLIT